MQQQPQAHLVPPKSRQFGKTGRFPTSAATRSASCPALLAALRSGAAGAGHPRLEVRASKTWMAGTSGAKTALRAFRPAMTAEGPGANKEYSHIIAIFSYYIAGHPAPSEGVSSVSGAGRDAVAGRWGAKTYAPTPAAQAARSRRDSFAPPGPWWRLPYGGTNR